MDVRPLRPCRRLIHHERGDRPRTYRHARKRTAGTDRKSAIAVHSGADQRAGSHPRARRRRTAGMAEHAGRAPDAPSGPRLRGQRHVRARTYLVSGRDAHGLRRP